MMVINKEPLRACEEAPVLINYTRAAQSFVLDVVPRARVRLFGLPRKNASAVFPFPTPSDSRGALRRALRDPLEAPEPTLDILGGAPGAPESPPSTPLTFGLTPFPSRPRAPVVTAPRVPSPASPASPPRARRSIAAKASRSIPIPATFRGSNVSRSSTRRRSKSNANSNADPDRRPSATTTP